MGFMSRWERFFGIHAKNRYYGCIVDLLGQDGLLEEAEVIIGSMLMKPDIDGFGWFAQLPRIHRDTTVLV